MKTFAPLFAVLILVPMARSAPAGTPAPQPPAPAGLFSLIGDDYKKSTEVTDSFFNPFNIHGANIGAQKKDTSVASPEAVVGAISQRGVSGIIYGGPTGASRVIIGDQVFSAGDELVFPDGDKDAVPLVPGATVVLRQVGQDNLTFDIAAEGDSIRQANFPLRRFWVH